MPAPVRSPVERLVIAEIERRRSFVRASKDVTLCHDLERVQREARASVRRESSLQSAWTRVAPHELAQRVRAVSFKAGVLTLAADDQSARFLADRWFKTQGRTVLAAALNAAVTRATIRITGPKSP